MLLHIYDPSDSSVIITNALLICSDPNWWKGANWRGEGLFPANFVTTDLNVKPEEEEEEDDGGAGASVEAGAAAAAEVLTIDEEKINKTLAMLQNADPTEEIEKDPADLVTFEEQCHKVRRWGALDSQSKFVRLV